jgi:hypothetical protein
MGHPVFVRFLHDYINLVELEKKVFVFLLQKSPLKTNFKTTIDPDTMI